MEVILIVLGIASFIGAIIFVTHWFERKRREELRQVADELGLAYYPDGSADLTAKLGNFALFNLGRGRNQAKLIQGASDDVTISIFDYRYTTGSGKHSQTHQQTVAALCSADLKIPEFTLRPEYMWDKIGSLIGMSDINFDSHPTFSKMFVLKSNNETAVRKFFKPPILEFFENHQGVSVEAKRGALIFYRPGRRVAPGDIKQFLTHAYEIYGVMVDHL